MLKGALSAFVFAVAALCAPAAQAASCSVLLDVSGSMAGFHPSLAPSPYTRLLDRLQQVCPDGYVFGDPDPRVPGSRQGPFVQFEAQPLSLAPSNNFTTRLGSAMTAWFAQHPTESTVIVVSDNVADNSAGSQAEQGLFNRVIVDPANNGLTIIAVRLPFDGKVFDPADRMPPQHYVGSRALAVYVVQRDARQASGQFIDQVSALVAREAGDASQYQVIRVRPLFAYSTPNATVGRVSTDDKNIVAELAGREIRIAPHPLDRSWTMDIAVTLRAPQEWVATSTVLVDMSIGQSYAKDLTEAKLSAKVQPSTPVRFVNGEPVPIHIIVPIGAMDYRANADLWLPLLQLLSGKDKVPSTGKMLIHVTFHPADIRLNPQITRDWDYCGESARLAEPNTAIQGRLFCLSPIAQTMVQMSAPLERPYVLGISSMSLLPRWPLYGFVGLLVLLAALLALFLFFAGRRRDFEIGNELGESQVVSLAFGDVVGIASHDEVVSVRARRFVLFMIATSRSHIQQGRVLWGDKGGTIRVSSAAAGGWSQTLDGLLRSVTGSGRRRVPQDWEDAPGPAHDQAYAFRIASRARSRRSPSHESEDPNDVL